MNTRRGAISEQHAASKSIARQVLHANSDPLDRPKRFHPDDACYYSCSLHKAHLSSLNLLPGRLFEAVRVTNVVKSLGPIEWVVISTIVVLIVIVLVAFEMPR